MMSQKEWFDEETEDAGLQKHQSAVELSKPLPLALILAANRCEGGVVLSSAPTATLCRACHTFVSYIKPTVRNDFCNFLLLIAAATRAQIADKSAITQLARIEHTTTSSLLYTITIHRSAPRA